MSQEPRTVWGVFEFETFEDGEGEALLELFSSEERADAYAEAMRLAAPPWARERRYFVEAYDVDAARPLLEPWVDQRTPEQITADEEHREQMRPLLWWLEQMGPQETPMLKRISYPAVTWGGKGR